MTSCQRVCGPGQSLLRPARSYQPPQPSPASLCYSHAAPPVAAGLPAGALPSLCLAAAVAGHDLDRTLAAAAYTQGPEVCVFVAPLRLSSQWHACVLLPASGMRAIAPADRHLVIITLQPYLTGLVLDITLQPYLSGTHPAVCVWGEEQLRSVLIWRHGHIYVPPPPLNTSPAPLYIGLPPPAPPVPHTHSQTHTWPICRRS